MGICDLSDMHALSPWAYRILAQNEKEKNKIRQIRHFICTHNIGSQLKFEDLLKF